MSDVLEATRTRGLDAAFDDVELHSTALVSAEEHPLVGYLNKKEARPVPTVALVGATGAWFALIWAITYVALPVVATAAGIYSNLIPNLVVNTLAILPAALITMGLVALSRPQIVTHLRAKRDPVIAATLGSLLVWFGCVETVDVVQPLSAMPWYEALTFTGLNVIEQGMFGMMLASFARSPGKAFALGAAFQLLMIALFAGIVG